MLQPILRPMDNPKTSTFPPFPKKKNHTKEKTKGKQKRVKVVRMKKIIIRSINEREEKKNFLV